MWYFTWILGVLLACACGIVNVMWLELEHKFDHESEQQPGTDDAAPGKQV